MLSPEASAEPGSWRTDRVPYLRGIMDAFSEPIVQMVVVMSSSQIGKTEIVNNVVGYYIDQDPGPMLVLQPNVEPMAKAWSKDRFAPMLRDSPRLRGKVHDPRSRDSGNTILHKIFPGGHITVAGANSPAGLSSRPIRIVLFDEIDRYPASAGTEGDPLELAIARTQTFYNRKIGMFSTPGVKGVSRIEKAYSESDRRRYFVPCPACGTMQPLEWKGIVWEKDGDGNHKPETVKYQCQECGVLIDEVDKYRMLSQGEWIPELPGERIAGFHLNALYSPFLRWQEIVEHFLKAKPSPERLQVFVNTVLGETWEEQAEKADATELAARREHWPAEVPAGVGVLTAGVDVQVEWLELAVKGWGAEEESWLIAHHRIHGDPQKKDVWERLEALLTKAYEHESGAKLRIRACMIDSGYLTDIVYGFVRTRQKRNVFASKGMDTIGAIPLKRATKANRYGVKLFTVGTVSMKDTIFNRLKITRPGPGYMHFCQQGPDGADAEYFAQFEAEHVVRRFSHGRMIRGYKQKRTRNEAIDLEVLNLAALHALGAGIRNQLGKLAEHLNEQGASATSHDLPAQPKRRRVRFKGF